MDDIHRFGIYALPDPEAMGALAAFGAAWLGWDVETGQAQDHPDIPGLDVAAITATPRKYGFHGTIKPPFYLADGQTPEALCQTLATLCTTAAPMACEALQLASLGRFLALTPVGDQSALAALAGRVVRELDQFRAPPTTEELTRRNPARLSQSQQANLHAWGYPYVFEDFRFHMTLTGAIHNAEQRALCEATLKDLITPVLPHPFELSSLCLVGSDASGRFRLIQRFALNGTNQP